MEPKPFSLMPRLLGAALAGLTLGLLGCGAGSPDTARANPAADPNPAANPPSTSAALGSASFQVNVETGRVTSVAVNPAGEGEQPVIIGGSAVSFTPSLLSDQPGDVGVKVVSVSLTNHFSLPIGQTPAGDAAEVRVLFSAFSNGFSDLRPRSTVTTASGTGVSGHLDGPGATATFAAPFGTATDGSGSVYITDFAGHRVRKLSGGTVSTLAGSGTAASVDGLGAAASFNSPSGIAINPVDGALFVADYLGHAIRRVTPLGAVNTIAGTGVSGANNGSGAVATFNSPTAIAIDNLGRLFVAEVGGRKIRQITFAGGDPTAAANYAVTTLAGSGAATSTDGVGTAASFTMPAGLTLGGNNDLFVCDRVGTRIRRVGLDGAVTTIAGSGTASTLDGTGDVATFTSPKGIVYLNGALIVSEESSNRLRQLTLLAGSTPAQARNWTVRTLAGTGGVGSADGAGDVATFNSPKLLSTDGSGNLFVADFGNNKLRLVLPATGYFPLGVPAGSPPATPVQLSNPDGVIPSSGFGINMPYISYPGPIAAGASTAAKPWWFVVPSGVNSFEFTVSLEAVTGGLEPPGPTSSIVRTVAGKTNTTSFMDGIGAEARIGLVKYDCIDAAGHVYFSDLGNNALRRLTPSGLVSTIAGGPGNVAASVDGTGNVAKITSINAVAASRDGLVVYFGDGNLVRRASIPYYLDATDPGNWNIVTLAGIASPGNSDGLGNVATFNTIEDMVLDPNSGALYLTEYFGNRVRKLRFQGGNPNTPTNWWVSTVAGDISAINGASGWTDSVGIAARFYNPRGIAQDRAGNLYVADQSNFRIRMINPEAVVTTVAGTGVQGFADGPGGTAQFSLPYGVAVDSAGFIYVGDIGNFDVRRIDPQGTVSTLAGTVGSPGGVDGLGANATFVRPAGVAVNASGDIYVCEQSSIRLIQRLVTVGTN